MRVMRLPHHRLRQPVTHGIWSVVTRFFIGATETIARTIGW